jgi:serine/threonine-protein kinase
VAKWNTDWAVNNVTKTGLLVGTPLYMSPEQARGTKDIDFRADLWSLAVITFQAMTGSLPFLSEGLGDLLAKIMFEPIPMPSSIVPYLPLEFDEWWARASSRDIEGRFQSAKELSDALAVALGLTAASTSRQHRRAFVRPRSATTAFPSARTKACSKNTRPRAIPFGRPPRPAGCSVRVCSV